MPTRKLTAAVLSGALVLSGGAALAQMHDADTAADVPEDSTSQPESVVSEPEKETDGNEVSEGPNVTDGTEETTDGGTEETTDGGTEDEVTGPGGGETAQQNHGQIVSAVARATPGGPGKGQIVSQVARTKAPRTAKPEDGEESDRGSRSTEKRKR